jgi:ribosome-associated protein
MNSVIDDREEPERPSKSQRKRDMAALQDLGTELVMLNADQLAQIELPERLHEAITDAQRIRDFEGRRRQMQFIGKLMRDIDPDPVREAIERFASGIPSDRVEFAAAERWREEMLRDDDAVTRFATEHPDADAAEIASLVRDARVERSRGGPPHRYRELFRKIRQAAG